MLLFTVNEGHVMRCVYHSTLQQAWYIRRSAVGSTNFSKNSLCLWRYLKTILKYKLTYMPGRNCAFFGCVTSQKHGLSLFKIPSLRDDDGQHTVAHKSQGRMASINTANERDDTGVKKNASRQIISLFARSISNQTVS